MKIRIAFAVLAALAATPALAQEQNSTISAGVTAGTLGIGPEAGFRFSDTVGVRASATFFGIDGNFDSDGDGLRPPADEGI